MLGRASRYAGHGGLKILVGVVTVVAYILDALHQIVEARHLMQERGASPKMGRSRYSAQRLNSRYFSLPSFPTPVISPAPSVCRYRDGRAAQLALVKMLMKQAIIFSIFFPISDNL